MGIKSLLNSTANVGGVDLYIDTAYDNVKKVADNLEDILAIQAAYENRLGIYLGEYTISPTERPDTSILLYGDHYLNTDNNLLYIYTSIGWKFHAIFYTQDALNRAVSVGPFNIWIAYADDHLGAGISIASTNKSWIGLANGKNTDIVDITDPTAFRWTKFKGEDGIIGSDGVDGSDGSDGVNSYMHIAYADSADGITNFNTTSGSYLGQLTDSNPVASVTPGDYTWVKIKGDDGSAGLPGLVDIEAPTVPSGVTMYVNADTINIKWDTPPYSGHWYTKVYRALWDGSNLPNFSEIYLIAEAGADFTDVGLLDNQHYVYWFRHVNLDNIASGLGNSDVGYQALTMASLMHQFNWVDTAHLTSAITNILDTVVSTVIDGEFGLLGAYNALKASYEDTDGSLITLEGIVGNAQAGLIKAHNDLSSAHDLLDGLVGDNNGGLIQISNQHGSRITTVENQTTENITRIDVLEVSTKQVIDEWTGTQVLAQSQTLATASFSTTLTSTVATDGILRIEMTNSDLGVHVAFNGTEITNTTTGFVGASSDALWYIENVTVLDGANTLLIWSDDTDQPTITAIELRDSLNGVYSSISSLQTVTGDHTTKLDSLGTFDGGTYSTIDDLSITTAQHTSRLSSFGSFSNNSYAVIDTLQSTEADHALKLASFGVFANGSYSTINDLTDVTATHTIRLDSFGTYDGNSYSVIDNLTTTTSQHATQFNSLGSWNGSSFAEISSLMTARDGNQAHFHIKTNVNNRIAGFGLSSTADTVGNVVSEFAVLADKFIVVNDANAITTPFLIQNGNVYMDNALVVDLTAAKLTAGTIGANDIFIGSSQVSIQGAAQGVGKGAFLVNDGVNDIVTLGYLDSSTVGLWIKDAAGDTVFKSSTTVAADILNSSQSYNDLLNKPDASRLYVNLIDQNEWFVGGTGTQGDFTHRGQVSENSIILGAGPYGNNEPLWQSESDGNNDTSGGWYNTFTDGYDHTKPYRFVVWAKQETTDGNVYSGCLACKTLNNTNEVNPYFWFGKLPTLNKWYIIVGILHGSGYTGATTSISGVYDPDTGERVLSGVEYKSTIGTTEQRQRVFLHAATTVGTKAWFTEPRIDMINGNEPSLITLFGNNALINSNTTANDVGLGNVTDGADITIDNVSASIVGQGLLATQDNINLVNDVVGFLNSANASNELINSNTTAGDIGYTGDLNATWGATWGTDINGQPNDIALLNVNTTATDVGLGNVTDGADVALPSVESATTHGGSLIVNSDMIMQAADGRPAGVLAGYGSGTATNISYHNVNKTILRIHSNGDNTISAILPAIRITAGTTYSIEIDVAADVVTAGGFYLALHEYDSNLPVGKTHVGNTASGAEAPVQTYTRGQTVVSNSPLTQSFQRFKRTYTPTSSAKWFSVAIINWSDMGTNALLVNTCTVMPYVASVTDLDYNGDLNANHTTNTNQLTDGANLGGTATWVSVVNRPTDLNGLDSAASVKLGLIYTGNNSFSRLVGQLNIGNISTYIAGASIGTALIKNAAITNALIANLDAAKINTGYLSASRIAADSIGANHLAANSITATNGAIANLTVDTIKIKNGAVTKNYSAISGVYIMFNTWPNGANSPYITDWTTIVSVVPVTTSDGSLLIRASAGLEFTVDDHNDFFITARLVRNNVVLREFKVFAWSLVDVLGTNQTQFVAPFFIEHKIAADAGSYITELQVRLEANNLNDAPPAAWKSNWGSIVVNQQKV